MTTNSIFLPSAGCLALLRRLMTVTLVAALAVPALVNATEPGAWIGTWNASPQPTWGADFAFPTNIPATLQEQTIRQVARISLGGKRIRIELSNEYGSQPLVIGAAHVALADTKSAIVGATLTPLKARCQARHWTTTTMSTRTTCASKSTPGSAPAANLTR